METMTTRRRLEPVKFERKCQISVGFFPVKRQTTTSTTTTATTATTNAITAAPFDAEMGELGRAGGENFSV